MSPDKPPASLPATRRSVSTAGGGAPWGIAEETPVEIGFNGQAWTVMMATPADLEDMAAGLALTEGAISDVGDIRAIHVQVFPEGVAVDLKIDPERLNTERIARRALDGRTGCGLCGVETLADMHRRPTSQPGGGTPPASEAMAKALNALAEHQPLNRDTRSTHAAAWCSLDGDTLLVREDVGRHNALDKLVGAVLRDPATPRDGFVAMSSRCSFELVFKAARLDARALASISAPTGLAIDLARELGLHLACRSVDGITQFEGGESDD